MQLMIPRQLSLSCPSHAEKAFAIRPRCCAGSGFFVFKTHAPLEMQSVFLIETIVLIHFPSRPRRRNSSDGSLLTSLFFFVIILLVVVFIFIFVVLLLLVRVVHFIEHELRLVLHQELRAPLHVHEQRVHPLDVFDVYFRAFSLGAAQARGHDHVDGVPQARLHADARQKLQRVGRHLHVLLFAPNLQNPLRLHFRVRGGGDDHEPV
mmetsp:Transcript_44586/g.90062  ORF Transcript_44586/g.90062 Transcript_44586/m.90062 type:complete len:207 (+) Transcript_44586:179-799(+)